MSEQAEQRLQNLRALVEGGFEAYPYRFPKTHEASAILEAKGGAPPETEWPGEVALAGRILALRRMGKITFAHLQDATGKIQLYFQRDLTPRYELLKRVDVGDILGVKGTLFTTKTGEVTVRVLEWTPLAKSLHPLPDKWHGLKEKEARYRRRYLDLIVNPETREVFRRRAEVVRYVRRFFEEKGFLEVETPILQATTGGAEARPFKTYHQALDREFYLRISLELSLKRLLVGGFEKVFEIGRNFRNEGMDAHHNPEFTMLEAYWAYADYEDMAQLVEELLSGLALHLFGRYEVPYQGRTLNFKPPFRRIRFVEALKERAGLPFDPLDLEALEAWTQAHHPELRGVPRHKLLDKLFGLYVEESLQDPTFVMDYPLVLSPLAKRHRQHPGLTERWDLYAGGLELAPCYSELNDPLDQRERFLEQARRREAGDEESPEPDWDFLLALEYGMPPAAGLGLGIDRLTMLMTDQPSLRDVLLFPLMKPREEDG